MVSGRMQQMELPGSEGLPDPTFLALRAVPGVS
jgi:hypothetical protein